MREYYKRQGGAVVSFAIDKYVYVCVNPKFDGKTRVSYSRTEIVDNVDDLQHDLIREAIKTFRMTGLEIATISDIPGEGTGLGSSSAMLVGLLTALSKLDQGRPFSPSILAEEAYTIEEKICRHPVGKQDQYASAYGSFHFFKFHPAETVSAEPIFLPPAQKKYFEGHLLLLWTGKTRSANTILAEQKDNLKERDMIFAMNEMVTLAENMRADLQSGYFGNVGKYLAENWKEKRKLATGISDGEIDHIYKLGLRAGADGGKLCGAGGGGFFLFWAEPQHHSAIVNATGLRQVDIHIEETGSKVIYEQT